MRIVILLMALMSSFSAIAQSGNFTVSPGKLEIVGVAQESDSGERWKKFIDNSEYKWHHVLSKKMKIMCLPLT